MTLADVALGQPHVVAHNDERHAVNAMYSELAALPSYAPDGLLNRYDAITNVYNWKASNTHRLKAAIAKAYAGTGVCRLAVLGDSKSDTYNGSGPGGYDNTFTKWPYVLKKKLVTSLITQEGGTGLVKCFHAGAYDPRLSFGGVWTNYPAAAYSYTSANNATITLSTSSSGEKGTVVKVVFVDFQTNTWSVSVDGASSGAGFVSHTNTGTNATMVLTLSGLSNATHSIVVKNTSAALFFVHAISLEQTSGIIIDNYSINGGATTSFLAAAPIGDMGRIFNASPSAVICPLGINDMNSLALTPAQVVANLTTLRGLYPNSDFILVAEDETTVFTTAAWQAYVALLYTLADTLDVPLIDLTTRFGSPPLPADNGLMYDAAHQNVAGDADWAHNFAQIIAA